MGGAAAGGAGGVTAGLGCMTDMTGAAVAGATVWGAGGDDGVGVSCFCIC